MRTRAGVAGVVGILLVVVAAGPPSEARSTKPKKRKPAAAAVAAPGVAGQITRISPTPFVPGPAAPSGTKITFEKDNTRTLTVPGSPPRVITRALAPWLLPGNGGIVYDQHAEKDTAIRFDSSTPVIRMQWIDGSNDVPIVLGTDPAVSYDERKLAFVSYIPEKKLDGIGVLDLQTGAGSLIVPRAALAADFLGNAKPRWSADNRFLAFGSEVRDGPVTIWVVGADGSGLRKLWQSPAAGVGPSTSWTADGKAVEVYWSQTNPYENKKVLLYLDGRVEQRKNGEVVEYTIVGPRQSVL
jgi:hypothetical protein